jgi:threonine/homoserine/homoserine lactone efflux protein
MIGLVTGLGAASADAFYACVAGFGLTFISSVLINQAVWIRLIGGIFLFYLGIRTFQASPGKRVSDRDDVGAAGAYASTFVLTITNPLTILSFAAIFAGLGLGSQAMGFFSAIMIILGVFTGSALWWLSLSGFVSLFRHRVSEQAMAWINRISGVIILGFGIIAIGSWWLNWGFN